MGYSKDIFNTEVSENFLCILCNEVLKDPVDCSQGHTFCMDCVKDCTVCPVEGCNVTMDKLHPNSLARKLISKLQVKCVYCNRWLGLVRDYSYHSRSVSCPNNGCSVTTPSCCLQDHLESCLYRNGLCEYCKSPFNELCLEDHLNNSCPDFPISCSNSNCHAQFPRKKFHYHREKECDFENIVCPILQYGCLENCPKSGIRRDVVQHVMSPNVMLNSIISLSKAVDDLKLSNSTLQQENHNLKSTVELLTKNYEDLSRRFEDFNDFHQHELERVNLQLLESNNNLRIEMDLRNVNFWEDVEKIIATYKEIALFNEDSLTSPMKQTCSLHGEEDEEVFMSNFLKGKSSGKPLENIVSFMSLHLESVLINWTETICSDILFIFRVFSRQLQYDEIILPILKLCNLIFDENIDDRLHRESEDKSSDKYDHLGVVRQRFIRLGIVDLLLKVLQDDLRYSSQSIFLNRSLFFELSNAIFLACKFRGSIPLTFPDSVCVFVSGIVKAGLDVLSINDDGDVDGVLDYFSSICKIIYSICTVSSTFCRKFFEIKILESLILVLKKSCINNDHHHFSVGSSVYASSPIVLVCLHSILLITQSLSSPSFTVESSLLVSSECDWDIWIFDIIVNILDNYINGILSSTLSASSSSSSKHLKKSSSHDNLPSMSYSASALNSSLSDAVLCCRSLHLLLTLFPNLKGNKRLFDLLILYLVSSTVRTFDEFDSQVCELVNDVMIKDLITVKVLDLLMNKLLKSLSLLANSIPSSSSTSTVNAASSSNHSFNSILNNIGHKLVHSKPLNDVRMTSLITSSVYSASFYSLARFSKGIFVILNGCLIATNYDDGFSQVIVKNFKSNIDKYVNLGVASEILKTLSSISDRTRIIPLLISVLETLSLLFIATYEPAVNISKLSISSTDSASSDTAISDGSNNRILAMNACKSIQRICSNRDNRQFYDFLKNFYEKNTAKIVELDPKMDKNLGYLVKWLKTASLS